MRRALLAGLALIVATSPATAYQPTDFRFVGSGLAAVKVYDGPQIANMHRENMHGAVLVANGSLVLSYDAGGPTSFSRLDADGSLHSMFSLGPDTTADNCSPNWGEMHGDPTSGELVLVFLCESLPDSTTEIWRITGLPRPLTSRPVTPGDLTPGTLDPGTTPPTFRPTGDGAVDISDVVKLLRVSVGLEQLRWAP